MSSVREMEEELKRLLLTASKPRSTDGGEKTDGKDGSEANSGKKIRKRRAKRRPKDGSGEEGDSGGAAGGASASSSSSKTSSSSARGTTDRVQKDKGGPTYPNGHPLRGLKFPCVANCPLCRYPGKHKDSVYSLWSTEDKKLWRSMVFGRPGPDKTKKDAKKDAKRQRAEKARMKKEVKENDKIDRERMKVVEKDLKSSSVVPNSIPNLGLNPDLVEAIRAEQKKLTLLKKLELSKQRGAPKSAMGKEGDRKINSDAKKTVDPYLIASASHLDAVVREKDSPPRKPLSETMSQKELVDIFGSVAEIPTDRVFADLENEGIFLLKKKNTRFPKAKFFCRTCDYHLDSAQLCFRHIYEDRHVRVKQTKEQDMLIRFVPSPSPSHVELVSETLEKVVDGIRLNDAELERRRLAVEKLEKLVYDKGGIPRDAAWLAFYGSSMTGLGTVYSDVNIDVRLSKRKPRTITALTTKSSATDDDKSSANPSIKPTPDGGDDSSPPSTSKDNADSGSTPRVVWTTASVMLKIADVLKEDDTYDDVRTDFQSKVPCIYATDASDIDAPLRLVISTGNQLSCETSKLLQAYSKIDERATKLAILFRYLGRIIEIDDPSRGTMPAYCLTLMAIYYCQKCPLPLLPVLQALYPLKSKVQPERMVDGRNCYFFDDLDNLDQLCTTRNPFSLGALWLSMLRFYSCEFEANQYVVSIRQVKLLTREEKKWTAKRVAMEDPFNHKRNLANCVPASATFDYISERLRNAFLHFSVPQLKEGGPAFTTITPRVSQCQCVCRSLLKQFTRRCIEAKEEAERNKHVDMTKEAKKKEISIKENTPPREKEGAPSVTPVDEAKKKSITDGSHDTANGESVENKVGEREQARSLAPVVDDQPEGFNRLVEMLTALVMSDALEEAKAVLKNTNYCNGEKLEALVKYSEETASHVLRDVMEFLRDEVEVEEEKTKLTTTVEDDKNEEGAVVEDVDEGRECDGGISVDDQLAPDVIVEASSNSSQSSSSSSEDDMSEDDDEESSDLEGNPNRRSSPEALAALFDGDLVLDDKVKSMRMERPKFKMVAEQWDVDQTFEPVCERCLQLRALLLDVEDDIDPSTMEFHFTKEVLGDAKGPPAICSYCLKDGHYKDVCPEEALPELTPLPPLTPSHLFNLNSVLTAIPQDYAPLERETRLRLSILQELQSYVRELFPDSSLQLFGSSVNGFGFRNSDMDICMKLGGHHDEEGLTDAEVRKVIERLATKFRSHRDLTSVIPITTAKVPIVKFTYVHQNGGGRGAGGGVTRVDGDISLYNTLALHNTRMLAMYADMDPRVRIIGYVMKVFAKLCDIGDASRGSLSSYAYIILALHFLQQRQPPVIPVLQEIDNLDSEGKQKKTIVDGWNAWYFSGSEDELKSLWPDYGKNKESVGELWIGLLRYYTEEFPIKDRVVTIKQSASLLRLEKMWTGPCVAIEDPFDLAHNLGGGLSRKMNSFILKAFIKGRAWFGTSPSGNIAQGFKYFFDPKRLTDGKPPADRGCHVCGKIGHYVRDCPVDKANKERLSSQLRDSQGSRKTGDAGGNNARNSAQKEERSKQNADEARRKLSDSNKGVGGGRGGSGNGANGGNGAGTGVRRGSSETETGGGGGAVGRNQRLSRTSQSSDDGGRRNERGMTPGNSTNPTPLRGTPPNQQFLQHNHQFPPQASQQPSRHMQHHQQVLQQQQQQQRMNNRHVASISKTPTGAASPVEYPSPPRQVPPSQSHGRTPPSVTSYLSTPPSHFSSSPTSKPSPGFHQQQQQPQQQLQQPTKQSRPMENPAMLRSAVSAEPSTPKFGQSLDMKELFAMAGGSPVSLGSLPGSVHTTPSSAQRKSSQDDNLGVSNQSGSRRASSSSTGQGGSGGVAGGTSSSGGFSPGTYAPFTPPAALDRRQADDQSQGRRRSNEVVDDDDEPRRPMAQHIAHIGSLSSSYAMQTRGGIFDAPLLAPPTGISGEQLMQDIQLSSNYHRLKESSPQAAAFPSRENTQQQHPHQSPSAASQLPACSTAQGRAAFHTIRSLDELAFESADAIGLGSSEMSFREIISAKLNPVPRKVESQQQPQQPQQQPVIGASFNSGLGSVVTTLPSSMSGRSFRGASSTWADDKLPPALDNAPSNAQLFSSLTTGSGLSADPLASIWSPITSTTGSTWTPETPSSSLSLTSDEAARTRYSREALMQLRGLASPRASLSTASESNAVGGSNDDILGLGNLFLPRPAQTNPIESGASIGRPAGRGTFSSMPFAAGMPGANPGLRGLENTGVGDRVGNMAPAAAHPLPHHQTNLSLTDDIKSALRIGEADASAAAAIRTAVVDAATAASASSMLRQMEQQPRFPLERLNHQSGMAPPRTAIRLAATNLRAAGASAIGQPLRPPLPIDPSIRQSIRMPSNPNLPSDVMPPQ